MIACNRRAALVDLRLTFDMRVMFSRPFVAEITQIAFNFRLRDIGRYHYILGWSSFTIRPQIVRGPAVSGLDNEDYPSEYIKLE